MSIGPKALRDSVFANQNKCATLRHGGRYGGSLSSSFDKGPYSMGPQLKKAAPPSVATVSKEFSDSKVNRAPSNDPPPPSNISTNNLTVTNRTSTNRSTNSLAGSGYDTDACTSGTGTLHKKSSLRFADTTMTNNRSSSLESRREMTPSFDNRQSQSTVYSIQTASYRATAKTPTHNQQQEQSNQSSIPPPRPAKSPNTRSVSIVNQPLPDIPQPNHQQQQQHHQPQQINRSHETNRNSQQPLSAANLTSYRSLQRSSPSNSTELPMKASRKEPSTMVAPSLSSKPTIPLPPKNNQPPQLPPKNRHKEQQIFDGSATLTRQNNNYLRQQQQLQQQQLQQQHFSGTSTLPKSMNSSSSRNVATNQAQSHRQTADAMYSTFGYDKGQYQHQSERDSRKCQQQACQYDRENNRQYVGEPKTPNRQSYSTTPHKSREHSAFSTNSAGSATGGGRSERERERDRSVGHHHTNKQYQQQQLLQQQQQHQMQQQSYAHRREEQLANYYRSMQRGSASGLTGNSTDLTNYLIGISSNNDLYSITEL